MQHGDPLPREADGRRHRSHHRRPLPPRPGRRQTLDISVFAPEKGDWVDGRAALSQGTLDLVYLAARLGLVRLVTGDRRPPLIFDDPFVTLDDARANRALELLRRITADFQVIYLTTSDRYDACRPVVELPGPTRSTATPRRSRPEAHDRARQPDDVPRGGLTLPSLAPEVATIVLGLLSALSWGCGDFGGGITSKRAPVLGVVLVVELVGAALAASLAIVSGEAAPAPTSLFIAVAAGFLGITGLVSLYRGLAVGRMGVVAPVTGVLSTGVPVIVGIGMQGLPTTPVGVGLLLGLAAVVLVSRVPGQAGRRSGIELALVAGLGIGSFNLLIGLLPDGSTVLWPLTILRLTAVPLVAGIVILGGQPWRVPRPVIAPAALVGVFDMGGNVFFILAAQAGALAIAAVLSSLYPIVTVILAIAILHEKVTAYHAIGIATAAVAVAPHRLGLIDRAAAPRASPRARRASRAPFARRRRAARTAGARCVSTVFAPIPRRAADLVVRAAVDHEADDVELARAEPGDGPPGRGRTRTPARPRRPAGWRRRARRAARS